MPAQSRKAAQPKTMEIGGVSVTADEVKHAITVLSEAKGVMVRQPLARAENPLAQADYHAVAGEQRQMEGNSGMNTKSAFFRALERLLKAE